MPFDTDSAREMPWENHVIGLSRPFSKEFNGSNCSRRKGSQDEKERAEVSPWWNHLSCSIWCKMLHFKNIKMMHYSTDDLMWIRNVKPDPEEFGRKRQFQKLVNEIGRSWPSELCALAKQALRQKEWEYE